jgi:hypothetical protein
MVKKGIHKAPAIGFGQVYRGVALEAGQFVDDCGKTRRPRLLLPQG